MMKRDVGILEKSERGRWREKKRKIGEKQKEHDQETVKLAS